LAECRPRGLQHIKRRNPHSPRSQFNARPGEYYSRYGGRKRLPQEQSFAGFQLGEVTFQQRIIK
jgi:hypothetical protein